MMYDILIWESKSKIKLYKKLKCDAANEAAAKTKCLADLLKLDKLTGHEEPWLSFYWEITPQK